MAKVKDPQVEFEKMIKKSSTEYLKDLITDIDKYLRTAQKRIDETDDDILINIINRNRYIMKDVTGPQIREELEKRMADTQQSA